MCQLPFAGLGRAHFLRAKRRFALHGLVQVHHIIPLQHASHRAVRQVFDVHDGANLMFMPTKLGAARLRTHRPCHEGGHGAYNAYVLEQLERMERPCARADVSIQALLGFIQAMRNPLNFNVHIASVVSPPPPDINDGVEGGDAVITSRPTIGAP